MSIPGAVISRFCVCATAIGLALWAGPASAAMNSFSHPLPAVTTGGNASAGTTIVLPATGNPSFLFDFILPRDYLRNGTVRIVLYLSRATETCTARIVPIQLVRKRIGEPIANSLSGLSGGNPLVDFDGGAVMGKVLTLKKGTLLAGQRPGDAITVQVRREADDPTDNCNGNVFVQAIDIRYPLK